MGPHSPRGPQHPGGRALCPTASQLQEWFGLNGQYTFLSFHCLDRAIIESIPPRVPLSGHWVFASNK